MSEITVLESCRIEDVQEREHVLQAIHDLRSPLSVLKILIAKMQAAETGGTHRDLLDQVAARIENIGADLVKTSRNARTILSLPQAVHAILHEKSIEFGGRVRLRSNFSREAARLRLDPLEAMRLLSNLINNSVQAGATDVRVSVECRGEHAHLSVSDNGRGFSEEKMADLNCGLSTLLGEPGHGFGLRHARELAARLRGSVCVRSAAGLGATVSLILPLAQSEVF